ncbi:MAG: hypothetical protein MUF83_07675 [Acidimicrobiales bacterium]|jgi:hypothetical protein|nr:hypothetical protein [Acidimicrobiales bacterium]
MRAFLRWAIGLVAIVHGLIHLLGVVEGFGWAESAALTEPIGTTLGVAWLVASVLVVTAGALLLARVRGWWVVAAIAAVVSQAVIVTSWSDAKAGTVANLALAAAAVYGFGSQGPTSFRARFRRLARQATTAASCTASGRGPVTDEDLARLPTPVAAYLRAVGAVGRPRVIGFRADISGRIRSGPDQPWMRWVGEQVNTFGPAPGRLFHMDAAMKGIPADVLHAYVGPGASMQVRLASLIPMVHATGPEMDRAETVTLLNDLCVLAPAALVDAPVEWTPIDDHHARATYTNAGHTVSAVLTFDDTDELVDFVSDDRLRASPDGRTFTRQRWSTPITGYRDVGGRRLGAVGHARWHPDDGPAFDYLEFHTDGITYLEAPDERRRVADPPHDATPRDHTDVVPVERGR